MTRLMICVFVFFFMVSPAVAQDVGAWSQLEVGKGHVGEMTVGGNTCCGRCFYAESARNVSNGVEFFVNGQWRRPVPVSRVKATTGGVPVWCESFDWSDGGPVDPATDLYKDCGFVPHPNPADLVVSATTKNLGG